MARQRFKLSACGSSRGGFVYRAHKAWLQRNHEEQKHVIALIIKPKYYVRCWGKLIPVTDTEAAMLRLTGNLVVQ